MTPDKAKKETNMGLLFGAIGIFWGIVVTNIHSQNLILATGYGFWCLYHGYQMMKPFVASLYNFGPVRLEASTIPELFWKSSILRLLKVVIPAVAGYFIGILGGAIVRQLYLFVVILDPD